DVVERFRQAGRSFLTPPQGIPLTESTVVDISHESLIRHWRELAVWVEEEASWARSYRHLVETSALHWRGRAGLWGDPDLSEYLSWQAAAKPTKIWAERYGGCFDSAIAFLDESRSARDAERRVRAIVKASAASVLVLFILGLSGLATIAIIQKN